MLPCVSCRAPGRPAGVLASVFAVLSLGACDKVPLLGPTASLITIVTSRSVLPIDGTAQIIATVIEQSGTPAHNGTLVTFTTTLGTLEPREAVTSNGQAVVTLRAGTQSGTASILAFSGSARTETPITVLIGGAAAAALSVTANPAVVSSTGSTVTITASVSDVDGNTLPGVPVSFSTTTGTLGATLVNSNAAGVAATTLTTSSVATVTATAGTRTATVAVAVNDAPTMTVIPTTTSPTVGQATTFTVAVTAGTNRITSAAIDFGDGTSLSLGTLTGSTTVSHVYGAAGSYTVIGTATDSSGEQVSVSTVVTVGAQIPLNVTLTGPTTNPTVNTPVSFTATATASSSAVAILRFEWSFGDGTSVNTSSGSTSHVYSSAGLKTVQVTAVAVDGREGTTQTQVLVVQGTAIASFVFSPTAPTTITAVQFNATASTASAGATITGYAWNFGDGSTGTGVTTSHTFAADDTYNVVLTVTDSAGATDTDSSAVTVTAAAASANFTISPTTAPATTTITFNASASTSSPGGSISSFQWNFGDGSAVAVCPGAAACSADNGAITHVYAAAGTYTITLTITDSNGLTDSEIKTIVIT